MAKYPEPKRSNSCWLLLLFAVPVAAVTIPCVLGILLQFQQVNSPKVIVDRKEWPPELEELVAKSNLSPADIASLEVVREGMWDGWFCRMRQSPSTATLITSRWIPMEKSPVGKSAKERFFDRLPSPWRKPAPQGRFYIHPDYNTQEEGNGTAYVGLIDDEGKYVFVWFYFNF
ncbi:MAG: hypothetical protein ACKVP0_25895 [Pirellulaceae bacterium]